MIKKQDRGIFRRASSRALILNTARKNLKRIQVRLMALTAILFLIHHIKIIDFRQEEGGEMLFMLSEQLAKCIV